MKRLNFALAVAVAFVVTAGPALAQHGPNELGLAGTWNTEKVSGESGSATSIQVEAKYGRFVSDSLELGVQVSVVRLSATGFSAQTQGGVGAFFAYHIGDPDAGTLPFVELDAGIGLGYRDELGSNPFALGGRVGIKQLVGEGKSTALTIAGFYNRVFTKEVFTGTSGTNSYGIIVGVSFFLE